MSDTKQKLVIATRESKLAMWQAQSVAEQLQKLHPQLAVSLLPMTTKGDQILDKPLSKVGGKGLFLKELEVAMLDGRAHLAVHSLKDVPMQLEPEFQLAAVLARHSPFDVLLGNYANIEALPKHAKVGSSSLRRQVQLLKLRPDLQLLDLRGNINTRIAKLERGEYHAIVLAHAGVDRLGLTAHVKQIFTAEQMLPAAGQGALAIECLAQDGQTAALVKSLAHASTWITVRAERALTAALGGSCQVPIAAFAELQEDHLRLRAMIGDALGQQVWFEELSASARDPEALGRALADVLVAKGASRFGMH